MKRWHVLRANKRQTFPRRVIFYDSETRQDAFGPDSIKQTPFLICAHYVDYESKGVDERVHFTDAADFWHWAASKTYPNQKTHIIAHNQDFDFRVTEGFTNLKAHGFAPDKLIIEYPRFIATFSTGTKKRPAGERGHKREEKVERKYIVCLDSLNWFRESLAQLGEQVGVPKLDMPGPDAPMSEWVVYCEQDVVVLRRAFEFYVEFLRENNLGTFGVTLAAQALNAFKTRFMKHDICVHNDAKATTLERQAYFGGRTECWSVGTFNDGPYYKVDINSMYPYIMREHAFPVKLLGYRGYVSQSLYQRFLKSGGVIADVTINTPVNAFPKRWNDKLCFPVGTFRTALCAPELRLLESMKIPYEVNRSAFYQTAPIFQSYVDELYALRRAFRKEGNDQYQYFCKILMNSLYGKFGQRNLEWESIGNDGTMESGVETIRDADKGEDVTLKKILGDCWKSTEYKEGFDSFPAISAYVTSYSRVYLWRLITIAGFNHVHYMDTDSLIVDLTGLRRLESFLDDARLGALKIEGSDCRMVLNNLKDYIFDGDVKIKGVPGRAKRLSENVYEVEIWEHFNGALMRGRPETVVVKTALKTLQREYLKGRVLPSGRVEPFYLNDQTALSL